MTVLVFTPDRNTGSTKDYTGAFAPESKAFAKLHGGKVVAIDISRTKAAMRKQVLEAIADSSNLLRLGGGAYVPVRAVAFFCHGYRNGLQLGFMNVHAKELADALNAASGRNPEFVVALYACSTGGGGNGGDGGFADLLRDALCGIGLTRCRVIGHDRAGHTSRLPYVRLFEGNGSAFGGTGGSWVVAPKSELWKRWVIKLAKTDLRFRFPFMEIGDIHDEVAQKAPR